MTISERTRGAENDGIRTERRSRSRYDIQMALLGWILRRSKRSFVGETVNISSSGILFVAAEGTPVDTSIELLIQWPVLTRISAVVATVVRSSGSRIAVRITHHQFVSAQSSEAFRHIKAGHQESKRRGSQLAKF